MSDIGTNSYLEDSALLTGGGAAAAGTLARAGFLEHVFEINESSKVDSLNIAQYSALAVLPVVLLNKSIAKWMPEADETKGSPEITIEVFSQITVMFLGLLFIHRVVTFLPPYSGVEYPNINPITSVLGVLMILLSLQTNLGEKVAILGERAVDLWEGRSKKRRKGGAKAPPVEITTPPSPALFGSTPMHPPPPATSYAPPSGGGGGGGGGYEQQQQQHQMMEPMETFDPLPANAASSAFGSALSGNW